MLAQEEQMVDLERLGRLASWFTLGLLVGGLLVLLSGCAISSQYSIKEGITASCGWVVQSYWGDTIVALQVFKEC